jgi:hypothetical protein
MNELPPEYFTADTGGSGMGAMRFMEGEFARREGQQPPTFGGIGAAISNGMSGVGQAINSAISGAPPPPPVGAAPVQAAVGTVPAQASGRATQQAQAAGGPPSWYTPQMDAFLGGLSSALMSGNGAAFTPAYEAILASAQNRAKTAGDQAAIAQFLTKKGLPAEEAALIARNPQVAQWAVSDLERQQERARDEAFNQRAAAIGSPTPSAPTASPAPTGQAPTAQPVANRPPAPSALEAERQRLVKMSEQYATLFSQAPSDRARQNLQFQINRVDAQIKSIDEAKKAGVPAGFQRNPDGTLSATIGGPADPNYLKEANAVKRGPATLAQNQIADLSKKGAMLTSTNRFFETFNPQFAGWKFAAVGDAANAIARNSGIGNTDAATWWQDYDRHKNVVRNELFGSALTKTEAAAFEKADINPGMTPKAIQDNLRIQQRAARDAAKKVASAYSVQGRNPDEIEAAIGFSLSDLGIKAKDDGQRQGGATGGSQGAAAPNRAALEEAARAEARRRGLVQ